ncbi:hypothetical protein ACGC1H_000138 [Rhizoctonia solani]|uniref:BTB domain-containing protein n=1 Tax=Rhizoctonia solani TaxID=456999 RepID=A0A8H2WNV1_9AGAM|nr:unnamed protein product [Rhizoctonia solani]
MNLGYLAAHMAIGRNNSHQTLTNSSRACSYTGGQELSNLADDHPSSPIPNTFMMDADNGLYTVILQDRKFTLTQSQVEFDGPNYFSKRFLGESHGSQTRHIKLNRDPDLFKIILNHLCGYTVLPLSAKQIPEHMSSATVLSNLRSDAVFYQLNGLVRACQEFASSQAIQQRRTYMAFVSAPLLPSHTHKEAVILQARNDCHAATVTSEALSGSLFDFLGRSKSSSAMTFDEIRMLAVVEEVVRSKLGAEYPYKWQLVGWDVSYSPDQQKWMVVIVVRNILAVVV